MRRLLYLSLAMALLLTAVAVCCVEGKGTIQNQATTDVTNFTISVSPGSIITAPPSTITAGSTVGFQFTSGSTSVWSISYKFQGTTYTYNGGLELGCDPVDPGPQFVMWVDSAGRLHYFAHPGGHQILT